MKNAIRHILNSPDSLSEKRFNDFIINYPENLETLCAEAILYDKLDIIKQCYTHNTQSFPDTEYIYEIMNYSSHNTIRWILDNVYFSDDKTNRHYDITGETPLQMISKSIVYNFITDNKIPHTYIETLYIKYPHVIEKYMEYLIACSTIDASRLKTYPATRSQHFKLMRFIHLKRPEYINTHKQQLLQFYYFNNSYNGVSYILDYCPTPYEELISYIDLHQASSSDVYLYLVIKYNINPSDYPLLRDTAIMYQKYYIQTLMTFICCI